MKISLFFKSLNFFSKTYIPSSTLIKQLRETTGSPIAECKSALQQFEGDMIQAKELLKKKGFAQAAKRLSKATQEGIIGVFMEKDRKKALIAEINCETDFVARTDLFKNYVNFALKTIYETKENLFLQDITQEEKIQKDILSLMSKINIKENSLFPDNSMNNSSLEEIQKMVISKLQENIKIRRIMTYEISNGLLGTYIHNAKTANLGTSACILKIECKKNNLEGISELADNLATQILGSKPKFLYRENIDPKILNEEIEQIKNSMGNNLKGKKEDIVKNIIEGKLSKFYEDNVLLDMNYVLNDDDSLKVGEYIKQIEKKIESEIKINDYLLWILGETKD